MALLTAMLPPERITGCTCGSTGPSSVATLDPDAATTVFAGAAYLLEAVQGADFPLSVPLVGGLSLTCPERAGRPRGDVDLYPVLFMHQTAATGLPSTSSTRNRRKYHGRLILGGSYFGLGQFVGMYVGLCCLCIPCIFQCLCIRC